MEDSMKKRSAKTIFIETFLHLATHTDTDKITTKRIVEDSGLSLQTFYNHFKNKEDLILKWHNSETEALMAGIGSRDYAFCDAMRDYLEFYKSHGDVILNLIKNTHGQFSFLNHIAESSCRIMSLHICQQRGTAKLPADLDIQLRVYVVGLINIYPEWLTKYADMPTDDFIACLLDSAPEALKPYLR